MMSRVLRWGLACLLATVAGGAMPVAAQTPLPSQTLPPSQQPPPPPVKKWTDTVSGGLALTSGNKETSTFNAGYEVIYDPKARNLMKSDGLFLRGKTDGALSAERINFNARDEYRIQDGFFVFGQVQYLRDRFKQIDYLISQTSGIGYRVVQTERTRVSLDAGVGGAWEKDFGRPLKSTGAITFAEKLSHALSPTANLTQSITGLHKTNDLTDALYVFGSTLAASVTSRTQVKIEVVDTYKTKVLPPSIVHNDVALIVAFVYKR